MLKFVFFYPSNIALMALMIFSIHTGFFASPPLFFNPLSFFCDDATTIYLSRMSTYLILIPAHAIEAALAWREASNRGYPLSHVIGWAFQTLIYGAGALLVLKAQPKKGKKGKKK